MKKLIFILILFFTSILVTNAASCKVISGDGTNIGDEIQCGTENFYVLSNDGKEIKMLAKYNLYIGEIYEKIDFGKTFETWDEAYDYYIDNYLDEYYSFRKILKNEDDLYYGILAYKEIKYNQVLQNKDAIGAHGDESGNPEFPEVGVVTSFKAQNIDSNYEETEKFYNFSINEIEETNDTDVKLFLYEYKESLKKIGINIEDISILSVSEIDDLVYKITEKNLPLEEWYEEKETTSSDIRDFRLGSIKEKIPSDYEWLWSTTYWLRTLSIQKNGTDTYISQYYVDTLGDICAIEYCTKSLGAGIRPVVTIPAYLIYNIETKTDGNGTVEADHVEAENGTEVKFTVTPKEGYVLGEVKVTDKNGNVVIFTDYTFTMPNADVIIEATFVPIPKEDNPNTVDKISLLIITIFALGLVITHNNKKRISLN